MDAFLKICVRHLCANFGDGKDFDCQMVRL